MQERLDGSPHFRAEMNEVNPDVVNGRITTWIVARHESSAEDPPEPNSGTMNSLESAERVPRMLNGRESLSLN